MGLDSGTEVADRLATYLGELTKAVGHADRAKPLRDYCSGLLGTEGRRSVEPIAVVTDPAHVQVQHQKLLHFVANSPWSDEQMLAKVREQVVPKMTRRGPIEAWIIDDTSFPKQGRHSVGVHHQYCGQLGKQANCQVTVTLSIANHHASLPIAYRLYLPRVWTDDAARREKAHVPAAIRFKTKPQIALEQIRAALKAGEAKPTKYWLTTVDPNMSLRRLVDLAKLRWRIEHDYRDLKQEIGLGHYEGRGWPGFHHHGTLCIAAYGFLISERERIPPSEPHSAARIEESPVPSGYRPRGAPDPAAAPRPQFDRHNPPHVGRCDCNDLPSMPVLPPPPAAQPETEFMTQ